MRHPSGVFFLVGSCSVTQMRQSHREEQRIVYAHFFSRPIAFKAKAKDWANQGTSEWPFPVFTHLALYTF